MPHPSRRAQLLHHPSCFPRRRDGATDDRTPDGDGFGREQPASLTWVSAGSGAEKAIRCCDCTVIRSFHGEHLSLDFFSLFIHFLEAESGKYQGLCWINLTHFFVIMSFLLGHCWCDGSLAYSSLRVPSGHRSLGFPVTRFLRGRVLQPPLLPLLPQPLMFLKPSDGVSTTPQSSWLKAFETKLRVCAL